MTLSDLLTDLYGRLNFTSSPAASVTSRLTRHLNQAHREILTRPGMEKLRETTLPFASVADQTTYGLPPSIARITNITDRTNQIRLREWTLDDLRRLDPGLSASGTPDAYVRLGLQPVAVQPSAAAELFIKSTSASDTNNAYLEGIRTGGYLHRVGPVTMTGATAVSLGSTITDWITVTKVYLSAAAVGTVTLHQTSGAGTELARIPIGGLFARYYGIQLWPTPASAVTYYVDATRVIPDLANATDEPLLPLDFHYLLVEAALLKEWTKQDDTRGRSSAALTDGLKALRSFVLYPPDYPTGAAPAGAISNLGSWYPGGTW